VQKDFNSFWLAMTAEFNRLLGKGEPMTAVQRRGLLNEVKQIIITTLSVSIQDPRLRSDLMERMASAFDTAGI
jgi:ribosome maturation protein Sdo1